MEMLLFQLEKSSRTPMYEQLYEGIKKEIIEGGILEKEKLPSKRKLSAFLNVSQTTIEMAYAQLLAEGYIISKPKIGYFVQDVEELSFQKSPVSPSTQATVHESFKTDFSPGKIDLNHFPFNTWRKYAKNTIDESEKHLLLLGHPQGDIELRQEIAAYLYQSRGIRCSPEQIVIGSGTEQLMPLLIRILNRNSIYAIENPGYPLSHHIFMNNNHPIVPINVDDDGIIVKDLENSHANVVYVTPSHQFPTGAILSAARRIQLLNWAAMSPNRYIIEDDYDSEFRYLGKPIPALLGMDQSESVIYISTFSKSLMPSLRIAYMLLPTTLLKTFTQTFSYYSSTVPRIEQNVLMNFMKDGHFSRHLNRMRKIYRKKLEKLTATLGEYSPSIEISGEQAGMHLLLTVRSPQTDEELVTKAKEKGIRVYGISEYYVTNAPVSVHPRILLGFGGLSIEEIETSIHELMHIWNIKKP